PQYATIVPYSTHVRSPHPGPAPGYAPPPGAPYGAPPPGAPVPPPGAAPSPGGPAPSAEDPVWAMVAHLSGAIVACLGWIPPLIVDRKSTRLNSSHVKI